MKNASLFVLLLLAGSAAAQRPIFEPDDFLDPGMHGGTIFLSRVVAGGVWNQSDRFRPIAGDSGLVVLTNSLYTGRFQFEYEHTEFKREETGPCVRYSRDGRAFPCRDENFQQSTDPAAQRGDTLQVAFYRTGDRTLRYRFSFSRQSIESESFNDGVLVRRSGYDQSFTLDADTHLSLGGRGLYGTLYFARSTRSGMTSGDDDVQNEIAYVFRPPGFDAGPFLFRTKLAVGGITGRDAGGVNLINPYFETFWRHGRTKVNLHLVWSGEWTRAGATGWRANHQVAVFLDRTLFVKIFGGE